MSQPPAGSGNTAFFHHLLLPFDKFFGAIDTALVKHEVTHGRFNQNRILLDLPGLGTVPFEIGGYEVDDLARLRAVLERP